MERTAKNLEAIRKEVKTMKKIYEIWITKKGEQPVYFGKTPIVRQANTIVKHLEKKFPKWLGYIIKIEIERG